MYFVGYQFAWLANTVSVTLSQNHIITAESYLHETCKLTSPSDSEVIRAQNHPMYSQPS